MVLEGKAKVMAKVEVRIRVVPEEKVRRGARVGGQ
jgi:hypothetical protein